MKTDITPEQVAKYQEQGFIVIKDFLSAAELEHWREVTEAAVRVRLWKPLQDLNNQTDPDTFYAQVFTQALRLADILRADGGADL